MRAIRALVVLAGVFVAIGAPSQAQTPRPRYQAISAGNEHTCATSEPGVVFCWGSSGNGRFGAPSRNMCQNNECYDYPVAVTGQGFSQVSSGAEHTCGLSNKMAMCTGDLWSIAQGKTIRAFLSTFTPVAGVEFLSLTGGRRFTCGIAVDSAAYCWGWGKEGRLGTGQVTDTALPAKVSGAPRFKVIEAGDSFACGLMADGAAWCWGRGREGQLGNDTTLDSPVPVRVAGDQKFTSISAGTDHVCALAADSTAFCWGRGREGQLQFKGKAASDVPMKFGEQRFVEISAGTRYTCAIAPDKTAFCWGDSLRGALGGSSGGSALRPVTTGRGTEYGLLNYGFRTISTGEGHACGVVQDWSVWCWGDGLTGKLGNSKLNTSYPMPISAPR